MIRWLIGAAFVFSLVSCKSVGPKDSSLESTRDGVAYNLEGEEFFCAPRNPNAVCISDPRDRSGLESFRNVCTAAGGSLLKCGNCGDRLGCSVPPKEAVVDTFVNEFEEAVSCAPRNRNAICTNEITRPSDSLRRACASISGGSIASCGACGQTYACKINPPEPAATFFDENEEQIDCPPQDNTKICTKEITSPSARLRSLCAQTQGGRITACGACGKTYACKVDQQNTGNSDSNASEEAIVDANGNEMDCGPRDRNAKCKFSSITPSSSVVSACRAQRGELVECGPCGDIFGCKVQR